MASVEKVAYRGWKNCRRISDGAVELIVTADVGPRIIRFGFIGGENEFHEYATQAGKTGGAEWMNYGGHRLWHAPEVSPRTYAPDNSPVKVESRGDWTCFAPTRETTTGISKEIRIRLETAKAGEGRVEIVHALRNDNLWAVELAPWAVSVMAPGGTAIIPFPPRGTHDEHLLPTCVVATWAYTDMKDPRWSWLEKHILLRQDSKADGPQKIGLSVPAGWAAYARGGRLFAKRFGFDPAAHYPDMGVNVESYTDRDMLELETLGPLVKLEPGASVEHREKWLLASGVAAPSSDLDVEKNVLPKL